MLPETEIDSSAVYQKLLARYCQSGEYKPIPGTTSKARVETYRGLILGAVEDALTKAYPITVAALGKEEWLKLVTDFLCEHSPSPPELWRMPKELYEFVLKNDYQLKISRPYLVDLLLFEWIEIEVFMMPDGNRNDFRPFPAKDLKDEVQKSLGAIPVINKDHRLIHLNYPVFKLPVTELVAARGDYFLISFRRQTTLQAAYFELSPYFARVFELLVEEKRTGQEAHRQAALDFDRKDLAALDPSEFFAALIQEGIILGVA